MYNEQTYCEEELETGLRNSDVSSPVLFNLTLEEVVRYIPDLKEMELIEPYSARLCR